MTNVEIASILREMSAYYSMDDVAWKPAAYEKAAAAISGHDYQMSFIYKNKGLRGLEDVPGIGPHIAAHIQTLLRHKTFSELKAYRKKYPVHLLELTSVESVGPKTVKTLYKKLGIRDLEDLERAARTGKLSKLKNFGPRSEARILDAVLRLRQVEGRKFLGEVLGVARDFETRMRSVPGVAHAVVAGSVRRMQETIGDIDLLVTAKNLAKARQAFLDFPEVARIIEEGKTKVAVELKNGMRADIRLVPDSEFGAALQYFTGDKNHNIEVRKIAISKGYKLNEYGLFKGEHKLAAATEEAIYAKLGLDYMEPELRTNSGEIEAAKMDSRPRQARTGLRGNDGKSALPNLIKYSDLRGDLQVQSSWTDGRNSIEQMAREAMKLGLEYIAITDHSQALAFAHGLNPKDLEKQGREIDLINQKIKKSKNQLHILKGIECDILKSGKMDLPDSTLAKLDFVGASIHSHFKLPRAEQTKRLIRAMKNPHVDIIFHPTTRRIGRREEADMDLDLIFKTARATNTLLEINASDRMDLRDVHIRRALKFGVKFMINSDSHSIAQLASLELGIAQARRGWVTKKDVLNSRNLDEIKKWLMTPKAER
ncbi:MAG: DNA polymerase/3'-5' exonuclease PolX [bacterium]